MNYNGELKVIDTQEKAYLLGQIYGDGNNSCVPRCYRMMMASIDTDAELYYKLASLFPFLKTTRYPSHPNVIYLIGTGKELGCDLTTLGMVSPKTPKDKTGEFHFPELREDLIPHFIRGYFDADGAAYFLKRKRSRNNLRIEFGCSTPNFLKKVQEILAQNGIHFTWYERMKKAGNGKFYMSYSILSSNRDTSLKFADFIYKDATVYLQRKYEICYKQPEYRPTAYELYGACPNCGGTHITRLCIRNGNKRRLKCRNCGKRFTKMLSNADS